jgi:hypothetical protein
MPNKDIEKNGNQTRQKKDAHKQCYCKGWQAQASENKMRERGIYLVSVVAGYGKLCLSLFYGRLRTKGGGRNLYIQ